VPRSDAINDVGEDVYEETRLASLYDHLNPWTHQDDFYVAQARRYGSPVLDVGAGTGQLAVGVAEATGLAVTGVEPGAGMHEVARTRRGAGGVTWIHAPGQTFQTNTRFRLAYMTGHAFQAVHTSEAATALLTNVARHLAPDGRFIFETRNPEDRAWLRWSGDRTVVDGAEHGALQESYEVAQQPDGLIALTHHIRLLDHNEELLGHSRLRFPTRETVEVECAAAGLELVEWYGDWDGSPLHEESVEMIAVTRTTR
jgi:ubiquinone/menaquinone biosynthesis C-methylase UbiE